MENKPFKITFLDEEDINKTQEANEQKIKTMLRNSASGLYSKYIVFLFNYDVCSIAELSHLLTSYYKIPFDKGNMGKYLQVLVSMGLVSYHESFFAMNNNHDHRLELIRQKHNDYLKGIPIQFHKKFSNMKYFYVTEYGEKFIPWCCENIGFKCEDRQ